MVVQLFFFCFFFVLLKKMCFKVDFLFFMVRNRKSFSQRSALSEILN